MKIEVLPDTSKPSGGYAIIRLHGVALWTPGATFRIDPIDDALAGDAGWPNGDLHPIETRQTADGIDLRVGPSVVDALYLEPGTPVTISVADSQISAELIWPHIPVSSGSATGSVVMTPTQMAAELAAAERAKTKAAEAALEQAKLKAALEAEEAARNERIEAENARTAALAAITAQEQQRRVMFPAARDLDTVLATPNGQDMTDAITTSSGAPDPDGVPSTKGERSRDDRSLSRLSKPTSDRPEPMAVPVMEREREPSFPSIILKRASDGPPPPTTIETIELKPKIDPPRASVKPSRSRLGPFLAGAGAASIAAVAVYGAMNLRNASPFVVAHNGISTGNEAKSGLADAFYAGSQSPRGEAAADVDLPTALRLADYNLHGVDRPVDRAEAEFWLKKAMSLTASHSQLRWAMTQLGTLSAEPVSGSPDYDRARMLWEIAAANGDPVAMCFLGTLTEYGLGVASDKSKALEQFKRSKDLGGCPNSDESIARLSK